MTMRLSPNMTLTTARRIKAAAIGSLSARELELVLLVASEKGTLYGGRKGTVCVVTTRTTTVKIDKIGRSRSKTTEDMTRTDELPTLLKLERAGWLRFADTSLDDEEEPRGWYWLTHSAQTVLRAAREGKRPLLES